MSLHNTKHSIHGTASYNSEYYDAINYRKRSARCKLEICICQNLSAWPDQFSPNHFSAWPVVLTTRPKASSSLPKSKNTETNSRSHLIPASCNRRDFRPSRAYRPPDPCRSLVQQPGMICSGAPGVSLPHMEIY